MDFLLEKVDIHCHVSLPEGSFIFITTPSSQQSTDKNKNFTTMSFVKIPHYQPKISGHIPSSEQVTPTLGTFKVPLRSPFLKNGHWLSNKKKHHKDSCHHRMFPFFQIYIKKHLSMHNKTQGTCCSLKSSLSFSPFHSLALWCRFLPYWMGVAWNQKHMGVSKNSGENHVSNGSKPYNNGWFGGFGPPLFLVQHPYVPDELWEKQLDLCQLQDSTREQWHFWSW